VWAFLGDGETMSPEVLGSIGLAAREELDNLIFVINCNLQAPRRPGARQRRSSAEADSASAAAVAAHRAVEALQVAVDHEKSGCRVPRGRPGRSSRAPRLIGLAVAEKTPTPGIGWCP